MYTIVVTRQARRAIDRLPTAIFGRVQAAIDALANDPRPHGSIMLHEALGWRIRVGPYRIIYEIDDVERVVTIIAVGHRRDVYR